MANLKVNKIPVKIFSSRDLKENISNLDADNVIARFKNLHPVKYNYKASKNKNRVGFITEDGPELVAMDSHKCLNSMDLVAVLTKTVQKQQKMLEQQKKLLRS